MRGRNSLARAHHGHCFRIGQDFRRRPRPQDPAAAQHDHVLRQTRHLGHRMADIDDRHARVIAQAL
jgi:hypothetical protein